MGYLRFIMPLVVAAIALPGQALAHWGENWGSMLWGTVGTAVPTLDWIGLLLLGSLLAATAGWLLRRRVGWVSALLLVLALPAVVVASSIQDTNLHIFADGTPAVADEVNANFDTVQAAVNDNDARISTAQSAAATAQSLANAAQGTADTAAAAGVTEETARTNADTALQTQIDAEIASRASADTNHGAAIAANTTAIADEAAVRSGADVNLLAGINAESAGRASADTSHDNTIAANATAIADEAAVRSGADTNLLAGINGGDAALDSRVTLLETGAFRKDAAVPASGETSSTSVDAGPVYSVTNTSSNIVSNAAVVVIGDTSTSSTGVHAQVQPSSAVGDGTRIGIHGVASVDDDGSAPFIPLFNAGVRGTASGNASSAQSPVVNAGLFGEARGVAGMGSPLQNVGAFAFVDGTSESAYGYISEVTGGHWSYGIDANVEGASESSNNYGGRFRATGSGEENYGIWASANGAATNWAGYLDGDVYISNNLSTVDKIIIGDASPDFTESTAASLTPHSGRFVIGLSEQLALDEDEIQARTSDGEGTALNLNRNGGDVSVCGTTNCTLFADGQMDLDGTLDVRANVSGNIGGSPDTLDHVVVITNQNTEDTNHGVLAVKTSTIGAGPNINLITFFDGSTAIGAIELDNGTPDADGIANAGQATPGIVLDVSTGDMSEWHERLSHREDIRPGDIVSVVGGKVTKNTAGAFQLQVVSTAPFVAGNAPRQEEKVNWERIAFIGQVPVKVRGSVSAGDYILPSGFFDGTGIARPATEMTWDDYSLVVGRAAEDSDDSDVKMVRTVVGLDPKLPRRLMEELGEQREANRKLAQRIARLEEQLTLDRGLAQKESDKPPVQSEKNDPARTDSFVLAGP